MWALLNSFSFGRFLAWLTAGLSTAAVKEWVWKRIGTIMGLVSGLGYTLFPGLWEKAYEELSDDMAAASNLVVGPAAKIAGTMTGLPITGADLASVVAGGLSEGERQRLGASFTAIFDDIFRPGEVAEGYLNRLPGPAERAAFERFMGRNAQLQMTGIMVDLLKDRLPHGVTEGIADIVDRSEKIMGFEDSQEEIMEPLMEKLIIEGLNKHYNRVTKPVDLTASDALNAYIRNYISDQQLHAILDNEGIRQDIRPILLNMAAKNLTEADFRDLYQRGLWTRDDVFAAFRANGYLQEDAQDKTTLVTHDRLIALQKELLNCKETMFAHGHIAESEFRNYLATMHFDNAEQDMEVEIAKCKASMRATAKPKQIAGTFNVAPARLKPGAAAIMTWNIRNAETVTITGLGTVPNRGERVLYPEISQTYYLDASSDTDSERFEAVVVVGDTKEVKRPTVTFSASPNRVKLAEPVELKWVTSGADIVTIEQVGAVAEAGATIVFPFLTTIYTIRATNAQGTTTRQDVVFVELPGIDFGRDQRPAISFSITPGVVKASQPQAELNWSITRAEEGELTWPDGHKDTISRNGAMIITASASGIYTISAKNAFGDTHNQEALIFQGAEEETP